MDKNFKRIILSVLLATTIISSSSNVIGEKLVVNLPYTIMERKTVEPISSGVVHESIEEFTQDGWYNINVLRIDLKDEHTKIKALLNQKGIHYRGKVSSMVEEQNALAGINGDFFSYQPLPYTIGPLVSEGVMISSPLLREHANPNFYLSKDNIGKIGFLEKNILLENYNLKEKLLLSTLNKVTSECHSATLLDSKWGEKSLGNRFHEDLTEILIVDDIVKEVRTGGEAFAIPENGYVVAGRGPIAGALNRFKAGHKVALNLTPLFDSMDHQVDDIDFAIGGGGIILENGELVQKHLNLKGNHPRTGIGINKKSTELILVTVDGRNASFKGVSQEVFGAIMKRLGAYDAINLDGGGSTTMAIKPLGEYKAKIVNTPSDSNERLVINGVGVFSDAPKGELAYLKLSTDDDKVFLNTRRNINLKGFDSYHNPVRINPSEIEYTITGVEGDFKENVFIPKSSGTATINAKINNLEASLNLQVLNEAQHIYADAEKIYLEKDEKYKIPSVYGKDELGRKTIIYSEDILVEIKGDIGYIKDGYFYIDGADKGGAITLKSGQGIKNILVSKGLRKDLVHDFENVEDYKFSSWPTIVAGEISKNKDSKDGKNSISLNYDFNEGENTRAAYINLYPQASGAKIKGVPNKLGLWVKGDNNGAWLRGNILDSSNKEHVIDFAKTINWEGWKYVETKLPTNISYPIALNRIYLAEIDNAKRYKGEILVDSLSAYYPNFNQDLKLPSESIFKDSLNKDVALEGAGFKFIVGNEPLGLDEFTKKIPISQMQKKINKSKVSIFLNGASEGFKSGLTNSMILNGSKGYSINKYNDTVFIGLNSSKDGIRAKDASQWLKFIDDLENRSETNIIITLPTPIFGYYGFNDKMEANLFHETLTKTKGKNIFVIHGDNRNYVDLKDGIRYMGINTDKLNRESDLYNQIMIEFNVNPGDISYKIINSFDK